MGLPDRLLVCPNGEVIFVELKRPGEIPTRIQIHWIDRLRRMGHRACFLTHLWQFDDLLTP